MTETADRTFDRVPSVDPRSADYPIRELIPPGAVERTSRAWRQGTVTDQGKEGACVGFGWMTEIMAQPFVPTPMPDKAEAERVSLEIYNRAKQLDEFPGENYSGSSVLAGAKAMIERGWVGTYRWAFSATQLRDAVLATGPVVLGIEWRDGMYETQPNGLVEVNGPVVGGHCLTVTGFAKSLRLPGVDTTFSAFRWRNSWGPSYGINGSGYVRFQDMADLLERHGEACVPLGRTKPNLHPTLTNLSTE